MNKVKIALKKRELTIGSWIQTGSPAVAEIISNAGFDWIAVDCEHSDIHINEFASVARGIYGRGPVTLARVRENDTLAIRQVLDMGAQGVIVPLVNNADEARKAVRASKYPPLGERGFGYARMNNWGDDFDNYSKAANEDIAVVVMIESKEAVENIDEILSVEGVDGTFIGPYDMSGSYGCVGETDNLIILKACDTVANSCARHNKSAGKHIVLPNEINIKHTIDNGFTFIALGADIVYLNSAVKSVMNLINNVL